MINQHSPRYIKLLEQLHSDNADLKAAIQRTSDVTWLTNLRELLKLNELTISVTKLEANQLL